MMVRREFVVPTEKEIAERRIMYDRADELGIDLLNFDSGEQEEEDADSTGQRDVRKAIVLLASGRDVPVELRERILQRKAKKNN